MAVEIVEEVGCDETVEKIDKKPEENEGDMSWNSSFSSAFKVSPSGIDLNGSDDLLWNEIDLAERYERRICVEIFHESTFCCEFELGRSIPLEFTNLGLGRSIPSRNSLIDRYLVSAMNEDAASTATTVLQTLSSFMHSTTSSGGGFGGSVSCCSDREEKEEEVEVGVVEVGKSDHEEMLECAGMVLLQSYRAIGR